MSGIVTASRDMKTRVCFTIDTEFSIGGAFAAPYDARPVGEAAVWCPVDGRSEGLGFLLDTFAAHGVQATFFVEALHRSYFSLQNLDPMRPAVEAIRAAGHDLQLHLHPCWTVFEQEDWPGVVGRQPRQDDFAGRPLASSIELIRRGQAQFADWGLPPPQVLRTGSLRWGSNLFHIGVLVLFFGHFVGMLTPHFMYEAFISAGNKQIMAMVSGGAFGVLGFIGVSLLLHRRLSDERIRINSKTSDIVLLVLLWLQLALGLATIPLSAEHLDGSMMMKLAEWAQRIVTFRTGAPELLAEAGFIFKMHMFLGMSIFLIFPFTRLVHVWSGFGTVAYLFRPYQMVRSRRLNVPARQNLPRRAS